MRRGVTVAVPGLALMTIGGLWAEVRRAAHAPLPHFADLDPSGEHGPPHAPPLRVCALGDSSLTGPGLRSAAEVWLPQLLAAGGVRARLASLARGGSRVRDVLERQLPEAQASGADLHVVAVGANDTIHLTGRRRFERDLAALLAELASSAPVLSIGIGDLGMIPRVPPSLRAALSARSRAMDRLHRQVCDRVPGVVRVPVAEVADPLFRSSASDVFAADRFHPNERGHEIWARAFAPFLRVALASRIDLRARPPAGSAIRTTFLHAGG